MGINTPIKQLNSDATKLEVMAMLLNVSKSAVSKMGNKSIGDVNLAKLKDYVEASGGQLNLQITLANGDVVSL